MQESNLKKCKVCNELKTRIQLGKFTNGRDKKWVDETGKQWSGHICSSCNVSRVKAAYHQKKISSEIKPEQK